MTQEQRIKNAETLIAYMRKFPKTFNMEHIARSENKANLSPKEAKHAIETNECGSSCCIVGYIGALIAEEIRSESITTLDVKDYLNLELDLMYALFFTGVMYRREHLHHFPKRHNIVSSDVEVAAEAIMIAVKLQNERENAPYPQEQNNDN
jgi:hypothetical protein